MKNHPLNKIQQGQSYPVSFEVGVIKGKRLSAQHETKKKKKCLARYIKSYFKNSIMCKQRDDGNYAASIDADRGAIS